ncbi:MAG: hypothetical protein M3680_24065 [Myxococcota bacterium]|nr:hypothetical protein [Myxococcota bacterium]
MLRADRKGPSMIRDEVRDLVALGPLPDQEADESTIERHQRALERITRPVTNDEARALAGVFGPDDCFGLAWTLLHLIESAPDSPIESEPQQGDNEWRRLLWDRIRRSASG